MSEVSTDKAPASRGFSPGLGLAALGIVFGDIGTSPLYTFKTILKETGGRTEPAVVLGALSLVLWTLLIVTTVKYVSVAMRIDNDGEGGILALMSLIGLKKKRPVAIAFGLFGAALIYGDGAVTPAISVLSALEGLDMVTPVFKPYILPAAVVILVALFAVQPLGTAKIGKAFGPVMVLWFTAIAVLGIGGILRHPSVFAAVNPLLGLHYLFTHGLTGFLVLGAVFLCVTGAEALYADMGHFGPTPIRLSWFAVVLPSLVLNYAGQTALVVEGAPSDGNIFYRLCPSGLLIPLVVLSTVATIIASQSIITGAFSMTRQAMQLNWLPKLAVRQTSAEGYGQIYVGSVNWLLMLATLGLAVGFGKSDNLAAAYGIAVSLTMLITTGLLFVAMREIWGWGLSAAGAVTLGFLVIDGAFFVANLAKVADGGYVPLLMALAVFGLMWVWHRGARAVSSQLQDLEPIEAFVARITERGIARVPGTAIFLTRSVKDTPPVLNWHVRHNRALHDHVFVLRIVVLPTPWSHDAERLTLTELVPQFWRGEARYGFMERPNVPALLRSGVAKGCTIDLDDVTYYVGHETIFHRHGEGLPHWQESLFAAMQRNAIHVSDFLQLPSENVVEIGRQVAV